jgi:hypothetical protein
MVTVMANDGPQYVRGKKDVSGVGGGSQRRNELSEGAVLGGKLATTNSIPKPNRDSEMCAFL